MKKTIIAAAALVAMAGCNKTLIETVTPEAGYGYINLGVSADTEMVVTKADNTSSENKTVLQNYTVTIYSVDGGNKTQYAHSIYSAIQPSFWQVPAGTYSIYVENTKEADAYTANNGKGQVWVNGTTASNVVITEGNKTDCTVACTPKNSKVSFAYTPSFAAAFNESQTSVSVTLDSRTVNGLTLASIAEDAQTVAEDSDAAFFPASKTLTWTLTTKLNSGEDTKTFSKTFTTQEAKWTLVKFAGGKNGEINVTITVDDEITSQVVQGETIDPLKGSQN